MATNSNLSTISSDNIDSQIADAENKLQNSDTAYVSGEEASRSDLRNEIKLNSLQTLQQKLANERLKKGWYGDEKAATGEGALQAPKMGKFAKVMDVISQPLYAEVGAASYLLGKSNASSMFEAANQNRVVNKETYGALLRKFDVPPLASMPIGFAMDIMLDPINVLTAGTGTMIGRGAVGLGKAGLKGASLGIGSKILENTAGFLEHLPGISTKKAIHKLMLSGKYIADSPELAAAITKVVNRGAEGGVIGKTLSKARGAVYGIGKKAVQATEDFHNIIGTTTADIIEGKLNKASVPDFLHTIFESIGEATGGKFGTAEQMRGFYEGTKLGTKALNAFDANNAYWHKLALVKDEVLNAAKIAGKTPGEFARALVLSHEGNVNIATKFFYDIANNINEAEVAKIKALTGTLDHTTALKGIANDAADSLKVLDNPAYLSGENTIENFKRMLGEIDNDELNKLFYKAAKDLSDDRTGVRAIDNFLKKVAGGTKEKWLTVGKDDKEIKIGAGILKAYDIFTGMFKKAKISILSPSSMVYAIFGNASMAHMIGFDIARPEFRNALFESIEVMRGSKAGLKIIDDLLKNPYIDTASKMYLTTFRKTLGIDFEKIRLANVLTDKLSEIQRSGVSPEEIKKFKEETINSLIETFGQSKLDLGGSYKGFFGPDEADKYSSEVNRIIYGDEGFRRTELGTSMVSNEILTDNFIEFSRKIEKLAKEEENPFLRGLYKSLDFTFKKSSAFESVDQSFKLANFLYTTKYGLTENELIKISRSVKMSAKDLMGGAGGKYSVGGKTYYKISPVKALEIANETYMNYAALPAFVKLVRNIPFLSGPFFSFTYAMMAKTGKTFLHNPAAFSQTSFLLKELQGDKSPLEKEALKTQYYSWLNNPGMINLGSKAPFFSGKPAYMNITPMIPMMGVNMFNPSERRYGESIPDAWAQAIDMQPFMKHPMAQVLLDYVILPTILSDVRPQNQFGSPLYPTDATGLQKTGFATRQLLEALVPNAYGAAAGTVLSSVAPNSIDYLPSYPGRKTGFAMQGKTPIGILGTEDPASRSLRAILSTFGINITPVELQYMSNNLKKTINK